MFSPVLKFFTQDVPAETEKIAPVVVEEEKEEEHEEEEEDGEEVPEFCPYMFMKNLPAYDTVAIPDRKQALPKISEPNKKALVLDLDETLVHCSVDEIPNADHKFMVDFYGREYAVHARKRPHIDLFLERVAKHFEVVVFTAPQVGFLWS